MKNKMINSLQYSSFFIIIIVTSFMGLGIFDVIKSAAVDGYFSVIIGGIFGVLLLYLFFYIFNYEPDLQINEKIVKLYGKTIGNIINFVMCISLIVIAYNLAYNLNNFIVSQFLTETPFYIIGLIFTILMFYLNTKDIDVISRVSFILTFINTILVFIALFGLIPEFDISNLKPILAHGVDKPLWGGFYIFTVNIAIMLIMLIIPKNNIVDKEKAKKYLTISYIYSIIIIFFIIIAIIGCLGIHLASYYQYPEYMVLKKINLFNFLDRIENGIIIQWIFGVFISISMIIYYISNNIKFKKKKSKNIFSFIISLIILILGLKVYQTNTIYNNFSYYIAPYLRLAIIFLFSIIGVSIKIKKQRN